jgi:hypothetical protein
VSLKRKSKIMETKLHPLKKNEKIKSKYNKEITSLEETNKEMKKTMANYKNDGDNIWMN